MEQPATPLIHPFDRPEDRIAFRFVTEEETISTVTYASFLEDVQRAMGWLSQTLGTVAGRHIGILARNSYHFIVSIYAIWGSGAAYVPLNIEKSWEEIHTEIEKSETDFIFHDGEYADREPEFAAVYGNRLLDMDGYVLCTQSIRWQEPNPEGLAMIMFTSGTTGNSKGVASGYGTWASNAAAFAEHFAYVQEKEKLEEVNCFFCLPLYHNYGICILTACLSAGYTLSVCTDLKFMVRDIGLTDSNCTAMVPIMVKMLARLLKRGQKQKLGMLRDIMCAGAPCDPEIFALFLQHDIRLTNHYGMTENGAGTVNHSEEREVIMHSAGTLMSGTEMKIVDGEILFRGKTRMQGYYNNPEATAEAIDAEGWLHTGDLGRVDEQGNLYITGRKKNVIILSSGENVNPEELEAGMQKNPAIVEAVAKEKNGKICAEIYCDPKDRDQIQDYIEQLNQSWAMYKRITLLEFREEPFPKTASGKIKRRG